jgi:hypothetical protein
MVSTFLKLAGFFGIVFCLIQVSSAEPLDADSALSVDIEQSMCLEKSSPKTLPVGGCCGDDDKRAALPAGGCCGDDDKRAALPAGGCCGDDDRAITNQVVLLRGNLLQLNAR